MNSKDWEKMRLLSNWKYCPGFCQEMKARKYSITTAGLHTEICTRSRPNTKQKCSLLNHDILSFRDRCNTCLHKKKKKKKNGIGRIWKQVAKVGFRDREEVTLHVFLTSAVNNQFHAPTVHPGERCGKRLLEPWSSRNMGERKGKLRPLPESRLELSPFTALNCKIKRQTAALFQLSLHLRHPGLTILKRLLLISPGTGYVLCKRLINYCCHEAHFYRLAPHLKAK